MTFWQLLRDVKLFRLLRVRWTGQLTDGIFQSALASFVLFSPERQASAVNAAVAFTVVLLPYSIVGPFVGTILDRFSRQRAIFYANLTRAITLVVIAFLIFNNYTGVEITVVVLVAFGVNRLILAGLSAGIPLMTNPKSLISANAIAVTGGSVWVVLGGGIGLGIRRLLDTYASADHADAIIILVAACGFLAAALLAPEDLQNALTGTSGSGPAYFFRFVEAMGDKVFVDFDMDVCDRSVVPACPAAAPGGISADELRQFAFLAGSSPSVIGADITEIDATKDSADERTVRLAALVVLELAAGFSTRH